MKAIVPLNVAALRVSNPDSTNVTTTGAFADGSGTYGAGDLSEPVTDHDQPPMVIGSEPCLCITASEGMRLRGLLGWAQRVIGS